MRLIRIIIAITILITLSFSSAGICGGIRPGQGVKVLTTGGRLYRGLLYSMDSESITLSTNWGDKPVYRADIAQMWKGKRAVIRGAALGIAAGFAAGFVYYAVDHNESSTFSGYKNEFIWCCGIGFVLGSIAGTGLTTWSPVDKAEFAVDTDEFDADGFQMQVSFRF